MSNGPREKVLVLGDDMRIFLTIVRSLGRAGKEVHAAPFNWHSPALKSKYIAKVHHLPRYSDGPEAWISSIQSVLRTTSFDLVIPCDDPAILPLHAYREALSDYPIAIPSREVVELLFDKERTRQLCDQLEIPVTAGARLSSSDTAKALVGRFGLPLVLKQRRSYWIDRLDVRGKTSIVEDEIALDRLLGTLQDHSRYLVEAYFEGVGVGVSVLAENGRILHAFQHRRLREGWGGCSSYRISEPIDGELYSACEKICAHSRLTGVCMFEFRYNLATRNWILIETNARFWGSLSLPVSLGVDFPRYLYDLLAHGTQHASFRYREGIRARNLLLDGFNLFERVRRLRRNQIGTWLADLGSFFMQPVGWMTGSERSDSFVIDDMRPGLWECLTLVRSIGQKLSRIRNPEPNRRRSEQTATAHVR